MPTSVRGNSCYMLHEIEWCYSVLCDIHLHSQNRSSEAVKGYFHEISLEVGDPRIP